MAYSLELSVLSEIERVFSDLSDIDYVERVLETATLPEADSGPAPRVHIALLWLSRGHIKRFDHELSIARSDCRDSLLRAGLAGFDWKQVLLQRGVDCRAW